MFQRLFGHARRANREITDALYGSIVAAARQEPLYSAWNVPDTPLGRFEMLSLHMFLVQHRLRGETGVARELAQILIETFFTDVDHSLRELGVGDQGVPKRMKKLARMFYGRTASYDDALDRRDEAALVDALKRNIRPDEAGWPEADQLAAYVFAAGASLSEQGSEAICAGVLTFPVAGLGKEGK